MPRLRAATARDVVLIIVAVVLLAAAGIYMLQRGSGIEPAPDDQYMDFRCEACGESFRLSHREFETLWDERRFTPTEDGKMLFECPKCGQIKAIRVAGKQAERAEPVNP
jgi:predicted RNA-binding Zn-ribbon protein involved in translation (DUF1610 family)